MTTGTEGNTPTEIGEIVEVVGVVESGNGQVQVEVVDLIDIEECANQGTEVPHARQYRVRIDHDYISVDTPHPTGTILLELVGKNPEQHELIEVFKHREGDVIGPDDTVNLREHGRTGFITAHKHHHNPECEVNIEGKTYPWDGDTITPEDIERLGGWSADIGVIVINADNVERTLKPGEAIRLEPCLEFAKRVRFKRG